jgi:hypothetical protein
VSEELLYSFQVQGIVFRRVVQCQPRYPVFDGQIYAFAHLMSPSGLWGRRSMAAPVLDTHRRATVSEPWYRSRAARVIRCRNEVLLWWFLSMPNLQALADQYRTIVAKRML